MSSFLLKDNQWVKTPKDELKDDDCPVELPERYAKKLELVWKRWKRDLDAIAIITGEVGSGKSTLGRLMCRYVSKEKFSPKIHMVRTEEDFGRVFLEAKRNDCILIDEGSGIFASTDTLSKKTKNANYILEVCRGQNLFIVICAPYFHKLGNLLVEERSVMWSRTYLDKRTKKPGKFAYYKRDKLRQVYVDIKKDGGKYTDRKNRPTFRDRFGKENIHEKEYKDMKQQTYFDALKSRYGVEKGEKEETPLEAVRTYRLDLVEKNMDTPVADVCKILGLSKRQVIRLRNKVRDKMALQNGENTLLNGGGALVTGVQREQYNKTTTQGGDGKTMEAQ